VNDAELARLRPTDGARYILELDTSAASTAHYRAWILTPSSSFAYAAALTAAAEPTLSPLAAAAPSDALARLTMFARLLSRAAPPWPHRIIRWRPDKGSLS
jgi:hypothetical protein